MFVLIFHGIISTSQPQHSAIKTFLFLKTTMSNFRNRVLVLQFYVRVRERTRRSQNVQLSLENYIVYLKKSLRSLCMKYSLPKTSQKLLKLVVGDILMGN